MSEWAERRLEDVVQLKRGFDLATHDRRPGPFPVVGSAGISGWHDEGPIPGPALVLGRAGSSMGVASYCETERFWPLNTALFVEDFRGNDPRFLFHLLQLTDLTGYNSGSAQPMLNRNYIRDVILLMPGIEDQRAISEMLKVLDDKIAVNVRIAEVSDELIRQRYADMVIRANEEIRIADLGFQVRDTVPGDLLSSEDNYIGLEHMPRRIIWLAEWSTADTVASAKSRFIRGDILFGKLRPYFHKVGMAFVDGVSSTDILVIRPKQSSFRGWLLAAISSDDVVAHASAVGDGTRMPRAKWSDLANYRVPWIGDERATDFDRLVTPLSNYIGSSVAESRALAELRDALLPKLMSGQIRVRDAEKVVEDVT